MSTSAATKTSLVERLSESLPSDVVAGLGTALVLVPQAMGYATLAGLPPIVGLHAATLGLVAYAALGTSTAMAIGPVAIDSVLTFTALATLGPLSTHDRVAAAGLFALMIGTAQIAMGASRLGHLANFLSLPVISGFTVAAAIQVVASQLPVLLGLDEVRTTGALEVVPAIVRHASAIDPRAVGLGAASVFALLMLEKYAPKVPRAPLVLAVASVVATFPPFASLATVGDIPRSLPGPALSGITWEMAHSLLPHALGVALIGFVEAFSVAKHFGATCGEPSASRELFALGAANATSGLTGGMPITGGLSRSAVHVRGGARTRLAGVVTAAAVLVFVFAFAPLLARIPRVALAATIAVGVASLVDVPAMRRVLRVKPLDGAWMLVAFGTTLVFGFQWGIVAGVVTSVSAFLIATTRPHVAVLGRLPGTDAYRNVRRYPEAEEVPGILLVRVDAELYFGNVTFLRETLASLEAEALERGPVRAIVLEASGINQIDSSVESALARILDGYERRGVVFALASVKGPVRDVLKRSGLWQRFGQNRLFLDVHSAVEAYRST